MECTRLVMTTEVSCKVYQRRLVLVGIPAVTTGVIHLPVPEVVQVGTIIPEAMALLVQQADMEALATLERHMPRMAAQAAPTTNTTTGIIRCIQPAVVDHGIDSGADPGFQRSERALSTTFHHLESLRPLLHGRT
jgi:hypothetical protein